VVVRRRENAASTHRAVLGPRFHGSVLLSLRYPTPFNPKRGRKFMFSLALQRRVDDREALFVLLEGDVGDAKHFAQLIVWHLHRAR